MSQHYSNPAREDDEHALPDVETFYMNDEDNDELLSRGWYYWFCFPGCLPDGDPCGPFATEAEALADARATSGLCEHGTPDDEPCGDCPAPELWVIATRDGRYLHFSFGALNGGSCAAWSTLGAAVKQAEALTGAGLLAGGCKVMRLPDAEARAWGIADEALADARRW